VTKALVSTWKEMEMSSKIDDRQTDSTAPNKLLFLANLSTAVSMSAALAHLMEMSAKMNYEPELYVRLHRTLYLMYGKTAGFAELASVISTGALALHTRKHESRPNPRSSRLAKVAFGCVAAAHAIFWRRVEPANKRMASWSLAEIPADWQRWRNQWEYSHSARAVLVTVALSALIASTLTHTPTGEQLVHAGTR
jgi:hypothetical protein